MSSKEIIKEPKITEKIIAPFLITKEEKIYWLWALIVLLAGLVNIWAAFLLGVVDSALEAINEGALYTYSISICAPFVAEMLIAFVQNKKSGKEQSFMSYKATVILIDFAFVIIVAFLWLGEYKSSIAIQVICALFSTAFSFYMYCVGQMDNHLAITGKFDDVQYLKGERKRMAAVEKSAEEIVCIESPEGDIEL